MTAVVGVAVVVVAAAESIQPLNTSGMEGMLHSTAARWTRHEQRMVSNEYRRYRFDSMSGGGVLVIVVLTVG